MYAKNKKLAYERRRRQRIQQDRRIDQVLRPWLKHKHTDIFLQRFMEN